MSFRIRRRTGGVLEAVGREAAVELARAAARDHPNEVVWVEAAPGDPVYAAVFHLDERGVARLTARWMPWWRDGWGPGVGA